MTVLTLKALEQDAIVLAGEIFDHARGDKRMITTELNGIEYIAAFTPIIHHDSPDNIRIEMYANRSPLSTYFLSAGADPDVNKLTREINEALVNKLFMLSVEKAMPEIIKNVTNNKQYTLPVGFAHWVKTEIDPRAGSNVRISYGDQEGFIMSTPMHNVEQTLQYLKCSLKDRGRAIPYVCDSSSYVDIDLSDFKWV